MRRRVREARVARLATIEPDGSVHLVPCTFALEADTVYSAVDHKPKTTRRLRRLRNIERDHRVTLLVDHYADDWAQLWWIRLHGEAAVAGAGPALEEAIELLAAKYPQYRERPPEGPAIVIRVTGWRGWSAT